MTSHELMVGVTQTALVVALVSSSLLLLENNAHMPYADPWFVPIVIVLVWQTWKKY